LISKTSDNAAARGRLAAFACIALFFGYWRAPIRVIRKMLRAVIPRFRADFHALLPSYPIDTLPREIENRWPQRFGRAISRGNAQ